MEKTLEEVRDRLDKLFDEAKISEDYELMLNLKLEINDAVEKYGLRGYINKYNELSREKDKLKN